MLAAITGCTGEEVVSTPRGDGGAGGAGGGTPAGCPSSGVLSAEPEPFRCRGDDLQELVAGEWVTRGDCAAIPGTGILHWDGAGWAAGSASLPIGPIALTGGGSEDVWVVGETELGAAVYRWDGSGWTGHTRLPSFHPRGIRRDGDGGIWVWGARGEHPSVGRWNGVVWLDLSPPAWGEVGGEIRALGATMDEHTWAVGLTDDRPLAYACDTDGWRETAVTVESGRFTAVWPITTADVWAAGWWSSSDSALHPLLQRWNGSVWAEPESRTDALSGFGGPGSDGSFHDPAFAGFAADDLWLTGSVHWNGVTWSPALACSSPDCPRGVLQGFLRPSPSTLLGFGSYRGCGPLPSGTELWRYDDGVWTRANDELGTALASLQTEMATPWALGPDDLWLIPSSLGFGGGC